MFNLKQKFTRQPKGQKQNNIKNMKRKGNHKNHIHMWYIFWNYRTGNFR